MNEETTGTTEVLDTLKASLAEVTMRAPVEQIVAAGRARGRRRRLAKVSVAATAAVGLALGVTTYGNPSTAPPAAGGSSSAAGAVHIHTAAYTVDTNADGTVHVTWDKAKYFEDRTGLQAALTRAGFPVLIRTGEFCHGSGDTGTLDPSGAGPGVDRVMKGESQSGGKVEFVFTPSAMPKGEQLFIGYLTPAQLAVTHGRPGSVERLVPTGVPLVCTTQAPPANTGR
ncbi:hypothetical protein [Streptacidiphilus sp. EB103A]|uniref:hypothetical protein n=1 Tax=Streptacidiphilus sp. EB103A TaxID=3156275 RepID=UPI00351621B1